MPNPELESRGIKPLSKQKFVAPSAPEINDLAGLIGSPLPNDYAAFVREYGCSAFDGLASVRSAGDEKLRPLAMFYGGGKAGQNVLAMTEAYRGRMPDEVIPIARDEFGNQFCLAVAGPQRGNVFFWDHEEEPDPDDYRSENLPIPEDWAFANMTLVARSLADLFRRIEVQSE